MRVNTKPVMRPFDDGMWNSVGGLPKVEGMIHKVWPYIVPLMANKILQGEAVGKGSINGDGPPRWAL